MATDYDNEINLNYDDGIESQEPKYQKKPKNLEEFDAKNQKSLVQRVFEITSTMAPMQKNQTNPYYNSQYFNINDLLEALRADFIKHDILLTQPMRVEDGVTIVESRLECLKTDAVMKSSCAVPPLNDPQKIGSCITYFRRYTLQSLLAMEADDDDGNRASGNSSQNVNQSNGKPEPEHWLNKYHKGTDDMTEEWSRVSASIQMGKMKAKEARDYFKVSKKLMAELEKLEP